MESVINILFYIRYNIDDEILLLLSNIHNEN